MLVIVASNDECTPYEKGYFASPNMGLVPNRAEAFRYDLKNPYHLAHLRTFFRKLKLIGVLK